MEINEYGFFQALESFQGSHILCKIAFTLLIVCLSQAFFKSDSYIFIFIVIIKGTF